jgi:hypothetical protein
MSILMACFSKKTDNLNNDAINDANLHSTVSNDTKLQSTELINLLLQKQKQIKQLLVQLNQILTNDQKNTLTLTLTNDQKNTLNLMDDEGLNQVLKQLKFLVDKENKMHLDQVPELVQFQDLVQFLDQVQFRDLVQELDLVQILVPELVQELVQKLSKALGPVLIQDQDRVQFQYIFQLDNINMKLEEIMQNDVKALRLQYESSSSGSNSISEKKILNIAKIINIYSVLFKNKLAMKAMQEMILIMLFNMQPDKSLDTPQTIIELMVIHLFPLRNIYRQLQQLREELKILQPVA